MKTVQSNKGKQKNLYLKHLFILFLSVVIVVFTLYLPVTVYRLEELSPVSLGRPFQFIHQYQTYTPPLPWNTSISTPPGGTSDSSTLTLFYLFRSTC